MVRMYDPSVATRQHDWNISGDAPPIIIAKTGQHTPSAVTSMDSHPNTLCLKLHHNVKLLVLSDRPGGH